MNTKQKGTIAEQAASLAAMQNGWGVLSPLGDCLPYDLVFDIDGRLARIQVKSSWFDDKRNNYFVDKRRTKTNRRKMVRDNYTTSDFDFALIYVEDLNLFYVMPVKVFLSYASEIHLVEANKRQRKPKSAEYRDAWHLISTWAADRETCQVNLVKFGETVSRVIPSQALTELVSEGVET